MKILQIYRFSPLATIGGVPSMIETLSLGLARLGHEVTVVGASDKVRGRTSSQFHGYKLLEYQQTLKAFGTPISFQLFKEIGELSKTVDLIHFHVPCPVSLGVCNSIKNLPKVVTYHADINKLALVYQIYKNFEKRFLNDVDAIVATSPNYIETSEILKKHKSKTKVITIGVEDVTSDVPVLGSTQDENLVKSIPNYILFLGAIRPYKNASILIEAAKRLPHVNFVLAGPGTEEFVQNCSTGQPKNLFGFGEVNEGMKRGLLKDCLAVILPSINRAEALGLSLIEGAMFSKPLLSFEIGSGTSYVNVNSETGFVVSELSADELCASIDKLVSDERLREMMGNAARARYLKLFSPQKMVREYHDLYSSLR